MRQKSVTSQYSKPDPTRTTRGCEVLSEWGGKIEIEQSLLWSEQWKVNTKREDKLLKCDNCEAETPWYPLLLFLKGRPLTRERIQSLSNILTWLRVHSEGLVLYPTLSPWMDWVLPIRSQQSEASYYFGLEKILDCFLLNNHRNLSTFIL